MFEDVAKGALRADDYTPEFFKQTSAELLVSQQALESFGPLVSLTLVDRSEEGGKRSCRYRAEFAKTTLLQHFVFDDRNKLADSQTEDVREEMP